ncbi:MAG TPA: ion channel [Gemmatimonadaceae bacterium]
MTTVEPTPPPSPAEEPKDLGFGTVVGQAAAPRLLNRDGSFNVRRDGLPRLASLSLYHALLSLTWPRFLGLLVSGYLAVNLLFAAAYTACGPQALGGAPAASMGGHFLRAFFFSVHTFATIGYGNVVPLSLGANLLVTLETIVGLLGFALATGVLFARFARPTARVVFSQRAVVAPYRGGTGFMFRLVNGRSNELIELNMTVLFSRIESRHGTRTRAYDQLKLERTHVVFFPLSWTVVHPIDETSPIFGLSREDLQACEAEFLILLSGVDETFAQTVHARTSYKADEVEFGARFVNIYNPRAVDGSESIDISRLSEIERVSEADQGTMSDTATWHHTGHFTGFAPPPVDRGRR